MTGRRGFSLVELLTALAITLGIAAVVFHLFRQNERVFHEQSMILEMEQSARAVASQIADEVRMAGQGTPVTVEDAAVSEAVVAVLRGSSSSRISLRAGLSNIESTVASPLPANFMLGAALSVSATNASVFSDVIGAIPSGRYVYLWGPGSSWGWVRAAVQSITPSSRTLHLVVADAGGTRLPGPDGAAGTPDDVTQFTTPPAISLEEAVTIFYDPASRTVKRAAAANMTDPANPAWGPANDLAMNVVSLTFSYYDKQDNLLTPDTLVNRASIAWVEAAIAVQTSETFKNGARPSFTLTVRSFPRNRPAA